MTLPVWLGPEAEDELREAAHWYEQQHDGLGLRFLGAVDNAVAHLTQWPEAAALVPDLPDDLPVRRAPVDVFPYHVAHLVDRDTIHVLAIAHDHRRPTYWRDRSR